MTTSDPSQSDLAWRSYSAGAMLPSFVICAVASTVLLTGDWFFDEARGMVQQVGSLATFALAGAIWIVQLFRWFYRGTTYTYRLTPSAVFVDHGFLYDAEPGIDLAMIAKIDWGAHWLCRFVGVGWVALTLVDGERRLLAGINRPAAFAEEIEAAVANRKQPSATSTPE